MSENNYYAPTHENIRLLREQIDKLHKDNEALRTAGESIVEWWIEDGIEQYIGAPSAMFALRRALGHVKE